MRKYIVTSFVLVPLLLSFSHAVQNGPVDNDGQRIALASQMLEFHGRPLVNTPPERLYYRQYNVRT